MTFAFVEDTAVHPQQNGVYSAAVSDRWSIGGRPNGGYLMGLALTALLEESPHPHPLSTTGHFLSPADPGPATIEVTMLKKGRSVTTAQAVMSQDGRQRLVLLASLGDLDEQQGPTRSMSAPPILPDDLVSSAGRPAAHPIIERFELLMPVAQSQIAAGVFDPEQSTAEFSGKIRFSDGMTPTIASLPLMVDAFPPAVFNLGLIGWTPTIELTVHMRGRPQGVWQILNVTTRQLIDGLLEEDAELWNEDGTLVAQSRQMARVLV
ncbi:MAG TPA: thioesterase family protein [Acidimicrobiia bacterium]|nr:thioesterase family protein [Acidimicrobiia bacterium]